MKTVYLFDVDGTIVDSGQKITVEMATILNEIKQHSEIGIVGGGKLDKILEQMDNKVYFTHYFSECGCVYTKNESYNSNILQELYKKNLREHPLYNEINILIKQCLYFLSKTDYTLTGHFIDLRNGIIYISLIGLTATQKEREYFIGKNNKHNYRTQLINSLKQLATELNVVDKVDIVEGGSVGIAIYPSEYDKTQILDMFSDTEYKTIYYFGDKYEENGNDFNLLNHKKVIGIKVDNYHDTIKELNKLNKHAIF